ncbi:hypothetical protein B1R32_1214 [Abditibacterium utsteinense]|uniref:Gas vesicle protein G n=1 Tax=Abditibacterium utsteinense TaxID=1960156 RepID=A0A2S8SPR7_9BACT|nr:hypothetical protein [Abditibacterium utsteinense]PQV62792.1 hypothetical protein B1R32_1214 [Abditibacterium utsteinense]
MSESYPAWVIETLAHDYGRRLALLQTSASESVERDGMSEEKQAAEVRSLILAIEKKSYQDAERHGLLDEEEWQRIAARIDAELFALKIKQSA